MNPFIFGRVVSGESFYDRVEETDRICSTLSGGNNLVLYAPRRYGKTSLVFKAMERLEKAGYVCIYIDIMMTYSLESFIKSYYSELMKKQSNISKVAKKIGELAKSFKPLISFDDSGKPQIGIEFKASATEIRTLEEILDLPELLASESRKYIVIMDEFQEISKFAEFELEKILRGKIQLHKNVNYLFLGSRTHLLQDMFSNKKRAFYNSALTMQISKLPIVDSEEYLVEKFKKFGIKLSSENAEYLIESADNIPYYIQLIASEVWQMLVTSKMEVQKQNIDIAIDRIIELKSDYYFNLFDNFSLTQKKLIKVLTKYNSNIYSTDFIRRNNLPATSTLQSAIKGLIENGTIEKNNDIYLIADPFFRKYLIHYV